jgi:Domain of unknown function (DUF1338)
MAAINELLDRLWSDYQLLNPQAGAIHSLLESRGERIVNDHIALRTYNDPRVGLEALSAPFVRQGYEPRGDYSFPEKKLEARHFEHPSGNLPRVFISELKLESFSASLQVIVKRLIDAMPAGLPGRWDFPIAGRPWNLAWSDYESLRGESEYAAWLAAFGFRANHFTILANELKTFKNLAELNSSLKENGFRLNSSGGEIKGSPQVYLEQSSTPADIVEASFTDGPHQIPACYYEFALRHAMPDGRLYSGFVEKSADKIFESTHKR